MTPWLPAVAAAALAAGWLLGRAGPRPRGADPVAQAVRDLLASARRLGFPEALPADRAALPGALAAFGRWVTEAWAEAQEERRRFAAVLSGMAEGVLLLDADGRVLLANDVAAALWPGLVPDLPGRHELELFQDADLHRAVRRALEAGEPQEVEVARPGSAPGISRHWRVRVRPLAAEGPEGPRALVVVEDVTDRRDLDRVRRDFVANVSHELKSPLTTIRGYAETVRDEELEPEARRRFLERIVQETVRMGALVEDLLHLAELEAPRLVPVEPVDLAELARDAVAEHRPRAEAAGLELTVAVAPGTDGAHVLGRAAELRLALDNLLRNAITYTPAGGRVAVEVGAGGRPAAARPGDPRSWLYVRVVDTGVGIPAEALPRIFERFYRVDPARDRRKGGTGLGLAIVKHAVVGHGGHVEVQSTLGAGSTFTVWLPEAPRGSAPGRAVRPG